MQNKRARIKFAGCIARVFVKCDMASEAVYSVGMQVSASGLS